MSNPVPYTPPQFASRLSSISPSHRLSIAVRPTEIHPFPLHRVVPHLSPNFSIKRDDLTGSITSGNKIRKLDFLLAHALSLNSTTILTAGGLGSNHVRSTVAAARSLGLSSEVFLRSSSPHEDVTRSDGNVRLVKLLGAHVHLVRKLGWESGLRAAVETRAKQLQAEGLKPYIIGIGGSNEIGLWGYIEAFAELMKQDLSNYQHVVVTTGSGGTMSGLAIGNYLAGCPIKLHAVAVCDTPDYFYDHLDEMLSKVQLDGETRARDLVHVVQGKGLGYAKSTESELQFIKQVAEETGVLLDPVYSCKGVLGMVKMAEEGTFGTGRVLFVHTGGVFGLYEREVDAIIDHSRTTVWE